MEGYFYLTFVVGVTVIFGAFLFFNPRSDSKTDRLPSPFCIWFKIIKAD